MTTKKKKKITKEQRDLCKVVKNCCDKFGLVKVSSQLGHRSQSTIRNWIGQKYIPTIAIEKVNKALNELAKL